MRTFKLALLLTASVLLGCNNSPPDIDPGPGPEAIEQPAADPAPADEGGISIGVAPGADLPNPDPAPVEEPTTDEPPVTEPPAADDAASAAPAEGTERVQAKAGVAKQGRSLDDVDGGVMAPLVTPAKAYFNVREKAVFEIQIPSAMKMYAAMNGGPPKTQEEFMTQIIQANQINLPELNAGSKYVYDAEKGELMVERPAR